MAQDHLMRIARRPWDGDQFTFTSLPPRNAPFPYFMNLPAIRSAVDEAERNIQAPRSIIFSSALTAIALVQQGLIDVRKPNGQVVPTSLMFLTVADSGERKSTAENVFMEQIRTFQSEQKLECREKLRTWQVKHDIWKTQRKSIMRSIEKKAEAGLPSDVDVQRLLEHENAEPQKLREFKILYEDSTSEALFYGLHRNLPTAGLVSSEGSATLAGPALNDLSKQNAIWSGDAIAVDRKTRPSFELTGRRLTVSLMVQSEPFDSYMARRGEAARGSGLLSRFLVSKPQSTQGNRITRNKTLSWECREKFNARIQARLEENIGLLENPSQVRHVVDMSADASDVLLDIMNEIEVEIRPGGRFENAGDHASKLADNIARVAAHLHWFEGFEGDISRETLEIAINICFWHSDEFLKLFLAPPREVVDAHELSIWLYEIRTRGQRYIRKNHIRQYGPNRVRNKARLNEALDLLEIDQQLRVFSAMNVMCVDLYPAMPHDASEAQIAIFGQVLSVK